MMRMFLGATIGLLIAGAALAQPAGSDLAGRTARAVSSEGMVSTVQFQPEGVAVLSVGEQQLTGRWAVEGDQLCFEWPGQARECWPFDPSLAPGQTVEATSDQGATAQVTWEN